MDRDLFTKREIEVFLEEYLLEKNYFEFDQVKPFIDNFLDFLILNLNKKEPKDFDNKCDNCKKFINLHTRVKVQYITTKCRWLCIDCALKWLKEERDNIIIKLFNMNNKIIGLEEKKDRK